MERVREEEEEGEGEGEEGEEGEVEEWTEGMLLETKIYFLILNFSYVCIMYTCA